MIDLDALTPTPVRSDVRPLVKAALSGLGVSVEFRTALPVVDFTTMRLHDNPIVPSTIGLPTVDLGVLHRRPDGSFTAVVLDTADENADAVMSTFGEQTEHFVRTGTARSAPRDVRTRSDGTVSVTFHGAVPVLTAVRYVGLQVEKDRARPDRRCRCGTGTARRFYPFAGGWVHKACADLEPLDPNTAVLQRVAYDCERLAEARAAADAAYAARDWEAAGKAALNIACYEGEKNARWSIGAGFRAADRHARRFMLRAKHAGGPTVEDVRRHPELWISGAGYEVARRTRCPHEYFLTDSCPGCDADQEAAVTG